MSEHYKSSHIDEPTEERNEEYSNDDIFNIKSWGADLSVREIITMYEENELIKPKLQRNYVWERPEASRFIESILLGLPVPSIFLAETAEEQKLIIDGFQRITTVFEYVNTGVFSKDGKAFKLTNSKKINERWRGKSFNELSEIEQRRIKSFSLHAIIFIQKEPKDNDTSMFQIFERINTGGRTLTAQEIRNCVSQGTYNDMLLDLNKNENWRRLFGRKEEDPRMLDMEFILRFHALQSKEIKRSNITQISLKKHLNEFMMKNSNYSDVNIDSFNKTFINTMAFILEHIGTEAFQNISEDKHEPLGRFSPTIFDAISIATNYILTKEPVIDNSKLKENHIKLLLEPDFIEYTTNRTTKIDHINGRINLATSILYGVQYE